MAKMILGGDCNDNDTDVVPDGRSVSQMEKIKLDPGW